MTVQVQIMGENTTLTVRIDSTIKERLEGLADATKRSKSSLAAEGIEAFVELEERQIAGIKKAIASLDRGLGVIHQDVEAWIASLDIQAEGAGHERVRGKRKGYGATSAHWRQAGEGGLENS